MLEEELIKMYAWYGPHLKWLGKENNFEPRRADLRGADLRGADLRGANLCDTDLCDADLRDTDLRDTDLRGANLRGAYLCGADLSNVSGILSPSQWLEDNFKTVADGVIVYKRIGNGLTHMDAPEYWSIEAGEYLAEVPNPDRGTECGCGVNFGTLQWCMENYTEAKLWECLIEWKDLPGVVVPFNTDGKARCERLKLVRKLDTVQDSYTGQDFYIIVELNNYDSSIRYTHGMYDTAEEAYASIAEFQPRIDSVCEVWNKEKYQAIG